MRRYSALILASALAVGLGAMAPVTASKNIEKSKVVGPYRIELQVLPPEPFFTAAQARENHVDSGMLIKGGATPDRVNSLPNPNHHVIVHVFNEKTGRALTDAQVKISYQPVDSMGDPLGMVNKLPVVVMQAIGKGPMSTHYGNNVYLVPTTYRIVVHVNGKVAKFRVAV